MSTSSPDRRQEFSDGELSLVDKTRGDVHDGIIEKIGNVVYKGVDMTGKATDQTARVIGSAAGHTGSALGHLLGGVVNFASRAKKAYRDSSQAA